MVTGSLSAAELGAAFGQATAEWRASGANTTGISVATRDLPGETLGVTEGRQIVIDQDAAGWGWSKMSLVTVIRHEVGHALGYGHAAAGLMGATLEPGAEFSVPAAPDLLPRVVADGAPMDLTAPALLPMDDEESDSSDSEDKPRRKRKKSPRRRRRQNQGRPKAEPKEEPKASRRKNQPSPGRAEAQGRTKDEATEEPRQTPSPRRRTIRRRKRLPALRGPSRPGRPNRRDPRTRPGPTARSVPTTQPRPVLPDSNPDRPSPIPQTPQTPRARPHRHQPPRPGQRPHRPGCPSARVHSTSAGSGPRLAAPKP